MRNLKYHEKKLLKKVNLTEWKNTNTTREQLVTGKYLLHSRNEYQKYNRIVGMIGKLAETLSRTADNDPTKIFVTRKLLSKLIDLGVISERKLSLCTGVTVSAFCNRRLPVVMTHKKIMPNFKDADKFIQQGHVKLGIRVCNDPSILVGKEMEEFITWVDDSKIKKKIDEMNEEEDDFM